jgi:amino acid transporter
MVLCVIKDNYTSTNSESPKDSKNEKTEDTELIPEPTSLEQKKNLHHGGIHPQAKKTRLFRRVKPDYFIAMPESEIPEGRFQQAYYKFKRFIIGRPLRSIDETYQRLTNLKAIAVFGSDAISSSAYATEAAIVVLVAAGSTAIGVSFYISIAVAILLSMVAFSYRQTVHAYPQGGGTYSVSRENLGLIPGLVSAAALMLDYVLTVAVSIVAGARAITSALSVSGLLTTFDSLDTTLSASTALTILISLFFIGILILGNLRGVRESSTIFSLPTYTFIIAMVAMIGIGLFKSFTGTLQSATPTVSLPVAEPLTLWLVLRAFSAGSVAMSGTEAISNGVPTFKPPESKNAATTLTVMAVLLGVFFLGISYLAKQMNLVPENETIISQIAVGVFGKNVFYYIFQIATMGILIIAANTAFAGFPRLSSVLARDNYMPHQFMYRGDRLAFSTGIVALGTLAAVLVILFRGNVNSLIHLYAIGVFLAFCMSSVGMTLHWWRRRSKGWMFRIFVNGLAAILTAGTLLIVVVTKFALGGWIIIVLVPIIVAAFLLIHQHYDNVAAQLRINPTQLPPQTIQEFVILPIDDVNEASLRAMAFARTISSDIVVIHISLDTERAEKIKTKLGKYAPDLQFVIIESPTRSFIQPLKNYIAMVHEEMPKAFVTIVLPEFITAHWWEKYLHNRTAERLIHAFEKHPNVTVALVPYLLKK